MKEYNNRSEVPKKYKLSLDDYYSSDEEWQKSFDKIKNEYKKLKKYKGHLKDSKALQEFLIEFIDIQSELMNLYVYSYVLHDTDLNNERFYIMKEQISDLDSKINNAVSFFEPEILKMNNIEFSNLFKENSDLEKFRKLLEEIYRHKKHILKENEEKIISTLTETFSSYSDISDSILHNEHEYGKIKLSNGETKLITVSNLNYLKKDKDSKIRQNVQKKFGQVLKQYQNTECNLLYYHIKNVINLSLIRNYKSPWDEFIDDVKISNNVFVNLKKAALNSSKILKKYYNLIKEILNLPELHQYDTLLDWNQKNKKYTIEESQKIVLESLNVLGENYTKHLQKIFNNRYIDYCSYKGKVAGGYSISTQNRDSRIILNFNGTYDDILTIAHECGHNVHHQYIKENNLIWYTESSHYVAEVASLTNEFLVNHYILKNAQNKEEKLLAIENILKTFENNFYGAVIEGEIEEKMYDYVQKGNTLTPSYLNNLVKNQFEKYEENSVIFDNFAELKWVTRSHYFQSFYLYSYAICVSVAIILASNIADGNKKYIELYESFLKCGSDKNPEEIYQKLNIDLTAKNVFDEAIMYFEKLINTYLKLYKEGEKNE